jgi:hypothetical protein
MVTKGIIQGLYEDCTKSETTHKNGITELFEIKAKEKSFKQEIPKCITNETTEIDINLNLLMEEYEENILNGPKYVCVCCGSLEFQDCVEIFLHNQTVGKLQSSVFYLKKKYFDSDYYWICKVCLRQIDESKVPTIALSNKLDFPAIDEEIKNLTELEERLCSPRVAFLKIRQLNSNEANGNNLEKFTLFVNFRT